MARGESMTGWCWDMRDEPYEDDDEDGVINGASVRAHGTTVVGTADRASSTTCSAVAHRIRLGPL
jgi:hypothetical protein